MRPVAGLLSLLVLVSSTSASMSSAAADQPAAAASAPSRTLKFATGETVVDPVQGSDHVVVKDVQGRVVSDSWCDSGGFEAYFALFKSLQESVARDDRSAVVRLAAYPFRVNGKKPLIFRNEASLAKGYAEAFTPGVQDKIRAAEPAAVFCRNGQGMLGNGVVWATMLSGGAKVTNVNP